MKQPETAKFEPLLVADVVNEQPADESWTNTLLKFWEHNKKQIIIAVIAVLIAYLLLIRTGFLSWILHGLKHGLDSLYQTSPFTVYFLLSVIIVVVNCTMIFSHAAICMLCATILNNFWGSMFLLMFSSMIGCAVIFYLSRPLCAQFVLSKIDKSIEYVYNHK